MGGGFIVIEDTPMENTPADTTPDYEAILQFCPPDYESILHVK